MDKHNKMLPGLDFLILTIIWSTGNYKRITKFILFGKDMDSMRTTVLQDKSTPWNLIAMHNKTYKQVFIASAASQKEKEQK